ncbi:hypothetical protein BKH46_00470 [Helicobacter sp. 12S02634-8]|uniref:hypothetical protein n=1 Tax=Helicobacter sp. 12S02634-8 TaxID=1476199 RepID=UPI000BA7679B|nr:hypothetical protein [Helicobacter sp. 12S02634-8]PAF48422.1 hypothetical protein BKH46_00470 [Helicobacter sp. 12S02634-8]
MRLVQLYFLRFVLPLVFLGTRGFADTFITDGIQVAISLKSNQVLLIDHRTQKPIGIMEITPNGKLIKLPLPRSFLYTPQAKPKVNIQTKPSTPPSHTTSSPAPKPPKPKSTTKPLIEKNRQWDKKQIPFLIQEETLPLNP